MATLQEAYELGADPVWRARCQTAALQAATSVMSEDTPAEGHDLRAAFANKVLLQPSLTTPGMAFGIAAQPGITGEDATDQDVLFTTNALWNSWSGVSTGGV